MKILLSWLKEFVDVNVSADELAHLLTMSGTEVGSVERVGAAWSGITIGRVADLRPHPNADHLNVVRLDLGNRGNTTLVTAATNLALGNRVPVVLPGGHLGPDRTIEAADFRGVRSEGMLCSGLELGVSPDGEGIYLMEEDAPLGDDLSAYLEDVVIDLELTPNRPDCLSVVGIAREVHALTGAELHIPDTSIPTGNFDASEMIRVEIKDPDLCRRYSALVIKGVTVKPSPHWLQRRLYLCGIRPISNIVDATNYAMLERGQPLHAFDATRIKGGIVVRRATPGETMVTLDGEVRELSPDSLVIADHQEAVAVAGVMGGLHSEVEDSTETVVLESANFDNRGIRRTSRELRLSSEASKRFDKGLDPELTVPSALRAAQLMVQTGGGLLARGVVDVYPVPSEPSVLTITEEEVSGLLGLAFTREEMARIFESLGFQTRPSGVGLEVVVPTFRRDVEGKADLAEELARIKGYDYIPTTMPTGKIPEGMPEPYRVWSGVARRTLAAAGFQEVISYSLVDPDSAARLVAHDAPGAASVPMELIRLVNPMTPDQSCLRTNLLNTLMKTVGANTRHQERAYIFELGRVYLPPLDPLPTETRTLGIALTGPRNPLGWSGEPEPGDFFDLKGAVEALLLAMGIERASFQAAAHVAMHSGRTAALVVGDRTVGYLGEMHPIVVERYDLLPHRVYAAELDFDALIAAASEIREYRAVPRFPAVAHDIALILDEGISHAEIEAAIWEAGEPLLKDARLFDLYRGASIPEGKKSLAYALTYRLPDRTLTDDDVAGVEQRIVRLLEERFGAKLRGR